MSDAALYVIANTRLPSQRAQGLQVAQSAAAFARAGVATTILHARRAPSVQLPPGKDVFDYYGVAAGARPALEAIACLDWIERVPRALQYVPARLQEQTFARNAARTAWKSGRSARVYARELEAALRLVKLGHARVYLEIHRVPGGRLRRRWLLAAAHKVRGIVAISGGVRADLVQLGIADQSILVEHDGFEPARFEHTPTRAAARTELGLPRDVPLVVYTGGLLNWKGVDVLVEAAKSLPDVYFAIAGGMDADVAKLRHLAGGAANVRIDGFQAPERVALYLSAADLGVVPNRSKPAISARYTSPLKVFESMAAGLPLVVSDVPSLRELLAEVEAAFVAPDDAAALRSGIERLLGDPARREQMSKSLRARAAAHTWDARARRILSWMELCERA